MSAREKECMNAIIDTLGAPPDWFDDDGIIDAESELQSPNGFTMHCPMPGSSESRMFVGIPDDIQKIDLVLICV